MVLHNLACKIISEAMNMVIQWWLVSFNAKSKDKLSMRTQEE